MAAPLPGTGRPRPLTRLVPPGRARAALVFGGPTLAVLVLAMLPVITGAETLILRDVLLTHLMLEAPLGEIGTHGVLPVLDVHRGGGQPLLGNPNALPFYPTRWLYAVTPVLWALNAHFWLHWLLAPAATFLLGRAWGLGRAAAWAAGVCYATSGFFLSQLNLYNLVAGAALVPALVAAVLRATEALAAGEVSGRRRRRWAAASGGLWALVLLAGDPTTAVVGAALAASAVAVRAPRALLDRQVLGPLALGIACGTLVALPQLVELLRVLPESVRGHRGFSESRATAVVWRPVHALEWLVPTAFGRFELQGPGRFWGRSLFGGHPPLFLSLYPGVLGLALVLAAGRPRRRRAWWAWGAVGAGALLAAGGTHPLGRWLFALPGSELFRYPVKLWLMVAVGAALLCGIGFERSLGLLGEGARETARPRPVRLGRALAAVGLVALVLLGLVVSFFEPFVALTAGVGPGDWTPEDAGAEWTRWIVVLVSVLVLTAALGAALVLARRRPVLGAALLLVLHAAGQVHLLRGLLASDEALHYARSAPLLERLPEGARVAHAGFDRLFGQARTIDAPDGRPLWAARQQAATAIPGFGVLHRRLRYELNGSAEGLSSFLSRVAREAVRAAPDDRRRLVALERWGVEYVISREPLVGVPSALAVGTTAPGAVQPVYLYRLGDPAPDVVLADLPVRVPHLGAAWALFAGPGFDPRRHAVLPPAGEAAAVTASSPVPRLPPVPRSAPGRVRVLQRGDEALEVVTEAARPSVLVVQRAAVPVWRATVDGVAVPIEPANLYRIGVPIPPGRHRVRLWVDRGPLRRSLAGAGVGAIGLLALALLPGRRAGRAGEADAADTMRDP